MWQLLTTNTLSCHNYSCAGAITTLCSTTAPPQHSTAQHTVSRHSAQTDPCVGSHNWAATGSHGSSSRSSLFASPLYVVFRDGDYDTVWNEYAWEGPPHTNPWFRKDLSHPGRWGVRLVYVFVRCVGCRLCGACTTSCFVLLASKSHVPWVIASCVCCCCFQVSTAAGTNMWRQR